MTRTIEESLIICKGKVGLDVTLEIQAVSYFTCIMPVENLEINHDLEELRTEQYKLEGLIL